LKLAKAERELRRAIAAAPRRILCVDLDGCLAEYTSWCGYTCIGFPRPSVKALVLEEHKAGSYIIIHTARVTSKANTIIPEALAAVREWLVAMEIPYDEIWTGTGKPYASLYLDDKAHNIDCTECNERWLRRRNSVNERNGINGKTRKARR